jgi:hypothetical protein
MRNNSSRPPIVFLLIASFLWTHIFGVGLQGQIRLPQLPIPIPARAPTLPEITEQIRKALGEQLARLNGNRPQSPILLDATDTYPTVPTPSHFANPKHLTLTLDNLFDPLEPGAYYADWFALCTMPSRHYPVNGLPVAWGPLSGYAAEAISTMFLRGRLMRVRLDVLQTIAWQLERGVKYSALPGLHQKILDWLIPDYKSDLQGDPLDGIMSSYNSLAGRVGRFVGLPSLDQSLAQQGAIGAAVAHILREREILKKHALDYEQALQHLEAGRPQYVGPTGSEQSPWIQILPDVLLQVVIEGGNMQKNRVNIPDGRSGSGAGRQCIIPAIAGTDSRPDASRDPSNSADTVGASADLALSSSSTNGRRGRLGAGSRHCGERCASAQRWRNADRRGRHRSRDCGCRSDADRVDGCSAE